VPRMACGIQLLKFGGAGARPQDEARAVLVDDVGKNSGVAMAMTMPPSRKELRKIVRALVFTGAVFGWHMLHHAVPIVRPSSRHAPRRQAKAVGCTHSVRRWRD